MDRLIFSMPLSCIKSIQQFVLSLCVRVFAILPRRPFRDGFFPSIPNTLFYSMNGWGMTDFTLSLFYTLLHINKAPVTHRWGRAAYLSRVSRNQCDIIEEIIIRWSIDRYGRNPGRTLLYFSFTFIKVSSEDYKRRKKSIKYCDMGKGRSCETVRHKGQMNEVTAPGW